MVTKKPRFVKITFHMIDKKKVSTIIEEGVANLNALDFPQNASRFTVNCNDGTMCFINPVHVIYIEAEPQ